MKESLKGAIFIIAAMSIFGLYGIFIRIINLHAFAITFFMFLISGGLLLIYFLFKDRKILYVKKFLWFLALLGFFNLFNNFFYFQAFKLTTISNAVLMHYAAPIFVALFAPFFLKERIERITVIALMMSIVGLGFILSNNFSLSSSDFIGILYGLGSGLAYGFVILLVKYLTGKISIYSLNIFQAMFAALFLFPFVLYFKISINLQTSMLLLIVGILFGIIATLLHISGVKRVKSQHAGILAYAEPFTAPVYALIFFSEIPSIKTVIGGLLILYGGYLIIMREKRGNKNEKTKNSYKSGQAVA